MSFSHASSTIQRRAGVLAAIIGLHFGLYVAIENGLEFRLPPFIGEPPPIKLIPPEPQPLQRHAPGPAGPVDFTPRPVDEPHVPIPHFPDPQESPATPTSGTQGGAPGTGIDVTGTDYVPAARRTADGRLSALIRACYPAASRRLGEEGKAIARVIIGHQGTVLAWSIHSSSGFPRLDAAMDCVLRRVAFVPARQDGRAVESEVLLPIQFRLD